MLHFIKGSSGTGKSRYIIELLKNFVQNGEEKILFIVPDQSSFETEKTFLNLLGPEKCLKINVLGFSRICDYIHSQNGSSGKKALDDGGKAILMSLAIEECQDHLPLFSNTKNKRELANIMLKAVKEYKTCNITPEMIEKAAGSIDSPSLVEKLRETSLIKEVFDSLVDESYIDPDDNITLALNSIKENNLFKDYIIALDSFSGFTKQELDFIEKLIIDSKDFYISLLTDNKGDRELFFTTERTCNQLKRIAKDNSVPIAPDVVLTKPHRFKNPDLVPIFNYAYRVRKKTYKKTPNGILIYNSANCHTECDFVARTIRKLIIEDGYMYDDIAVICRDDEAYCGIIDTVFEKYDVPYFLDKAEDIYTKPLVRFVAATLEAVNNSFRRESILNMLKSGLMAYSAEDISLFENYLYSWNISGTKFYSDFTDNPRGFVQKEEPEDASLLNKINSIRQAVIAPLLSFRQTCKGSNATDITKNLYDLLLAYNIPDNVVNMCLELEANGEFGLSEEQRRLWDILMNVLDKMIDLLSGKVISLKDYTELLMLQFNNGEIGYIPKAVDQVVISGIERVRLTEKKAVFLIGCNEGEFPLVPSTGGVFTDKERKLLIANGIEINDASDELNFKEMYLAFYAMTLAGEKLFISCNCADLLGTAKEPSSIIGELLEIYPNIAETGYELMTADDNLWCKNSAFRFMAERINTESITENTLKDYFLANEEYRDKARAIVDNYYKQPFKIKDKNNTYELFGKDMRLSASRVEQFSNCKFSYFLKYGINAKERLRNEVNALRYGTLMHYVFERFFSQNKKSEFVGFSTETIAEKVDLYFDEYLEECLGGSQGKDEHFLYLFYRMKENAVRIVSFMVESFKYTDYEPKDFELGIGSDFPAYSIEAGDGSIINVVGTIDRVDMLRKDGKCYVRVVDYKTGQKEFKISDILYGRNLQMLIYLATLLRHGNQYYNEKIYPTGILYQPASAKCASDKVPKHKVLQTKGIILDDSDVIYSMDKEALCRFIPITYKKDGTPDSNSLEYLCSEEEFELLFNQVDKTLVEMADALHRGSIEYNPIALDKDYYCKFCPYISVCGCENGDNCREQPPLKRKELFKKLKEDAENAELD